MDQSMKQLLAQAELMGSGKLNTELFKKNIGDIATENTNALKDKLPDYERTPTSDELERFAIFASDYKRIHDKASKREIRKAVQKQFNIRIYK